MGVQRALRLCMELVRSKKNSIYTLGPIIHNGTVTASLEAKGVKTATDIEKIEPNSWVLIRSHGVTPKVRNSLLERGINICDATCPKVARVQGLIKSNVSQGYFAVIIGDHGHAETDGLMGYAEDKGVVLSNMQEVKNFIKQNDPSAKICAVAQTTQDVELFDSLCVELGKYFKNIKIINTVCDATKKRQDEVKQKGSKADCIIVAGGKNSANTNRLCEIAQKAASKSIHIERAQDMDLDAVRQNKTVFVTAGASTPRWIIHETADAVKGNGWMEKIIKTTASKKFFYAVLAVFVVHNVFNFSLDAIFAMAGFALLNMEFRRYLMQKLDDFMGRGVNKVLLLAGLLTALFASIIVRQILLFPLLSYGLFFYMIYRNVSVRASVMLCVSNLSALFVALTFFIWR